MTGSPERTLSYLKRRFYPEGWPKTMPVELPNVGRSFLPEMFHDLGFKAGVEIGVLRGEFSEEVCLGAPGVHLWAVDPWLARATYKPHSGPKVFARLEDEARTRLAPYRCTIIKAMSAAAASAFEDGSLDFVYLDGDHDFLPVATDLTLWSPKIRPGGVLAGHDYITRNPRWLTCVFDVVNAWTRARSIRPWFVLGTKSKSAWPIRDRVRSFMWVVR